jgi:hypothetical protein
VRHAFILLWVPLLAIPFAVATRFPAVAAPFPAVAVASPLPTPTPTLTPTPIVVVVPTPSVNVEAPVTVTIPQHEDWPLILATLATALAGLLAAIAAIAIALDWPRQMVMGANLFASIERGPPDRHLITTYVPAKSSDPDTVVLDERTAYYCRLRIENERPGRFGRLEAKNVEVQLIRLWMLNAEGVEKLDPVFLPIRLVWSHVHGPVRDRIMPGLYNHADLVSVMVGRKDRPWLRFLTEVSPNPFPTGELPNIKPPGSYRLQLAVAASNTKTKFYDVRITWTGDFDPRDAAAMEEALRIEVTPTPKARVGSPGSN